MMRAFRILAIVVITILYISEFALFAGGKKEKKTDKPSVERTLEAQPQTEKAREMASGLEMTRFEGVAEIDYSSWEIGKRGGQIIHSISADPKTFNVIVAQETSTTDIVFRIFEPVVKRNILTLEWEPVLCESWSVASDSLSATFRMRPGLTWSDGKPLTAEDVVYSVNEIFMMDEVEGSNKDAFYVGDELAKVDLVDRLTFRITVPTLYADIISLANFAPVPKHILEPLIREKGIEAVNSHWGVNTNIRSIVGSGPFLLDEYVPNQRLMLKRNPKYWRKDASGQQLPYLDRVIYLIVEDLNTQFLKFQAGEIDIYDLRGEDFAVLIDKKRELDFEIYNAGPHPGTSFLVFNQNPEKVSEPKLSWFNDRRFRRAMAHLVDRQTIIDNVLFGFGFHQYSFVPRFSPLYWTEVKDHAPRFDPTPAKRLLDDMDLVDRDGDGIREDREGNSLSFVLQTNTENTRRVQIGEIISQEMRKAGVDVTFRPGDFNTIVSALTSSYEWEAILIGLTGSVQPFLSGTNVYPSRGSLHMIHPKQKSPSRDWEREADRLYTENTTTTDMKKRMSTGIELQRIWATELPWIYTVNRAVLYAYKNTFGNIKPRVVHPYTNFNGICEYIYVR